jgi:hypothetical protein
MRIDYNEQKIKAAAAAAARTAKEVGSGTGNVASSTGRAIKNEVGDIDVDVDVTRSRSDAEEPTQPVTRDSKGQTKKGG